MPSANKLLVTNVGALKAKYLKKYSKVEEAILGLIKADTSRGITTKLIALDGAGEMKRLGAKPIIEPNSAQETKDAIDHVWRAYDADYLAILRRRISSCIRTCLILRWDGRSKTPSPGCITSCKDRHHL
jgi:hypothetical protein